MELTKKRVLVTGGADFLGSHLSKAGVKESPVLQIGSNEPPA
jgi:nucleoside-diphosphate-sugar epimerase